VLSGHIEKHNEESPLGKHPAEERIRGESIVKELHEGLWAEECETEYLYFVSGSSQ